MLATYLMGVAISVGMGCPELLIFAIAVAISGSFSPLMYIHLVEARDHNVLTANQTLPSLQFATLAAAVSCVFLVIR